MVNQLKKHRRRAMSSEHARRVKLAGHQAEQEFADLIGGKIYSGSRKRDVVDQQGNVHSVKSGEKKWQCFLYGRKRFKTDIGFLGAPLFINCIDSFPEKWSNYQKGKTIYKIKLQKPMSELKGFLSSKEKKIFSHANKLIFLLEALFHSNEVDYFTIKDGSLFNVFDAREAIIIIGSSVVLANSKATRVGEMDNQKVIFRLKDLNITLGEIEMRNDSKIHYKQIKFWLNKDKTTRLLISKISPHKKISEKIIVYGKAINTFKLKK